MTMTMSRCGAATYLGLTRQHLERLAEAGLGPAFLHIPPYFQYSKDDLDRWRADHKGLILELQLARDVWASARKRTQRFEQHAQGAML